MCQVKWIVFHQQRQHQSPALSSPKIFAIPIKTFLFFLCCNSHDNCAVQGRMCGNEDRGGKIGEREIGEREMSERLFTTIPFLSFCPKIALFPNSHPFPSISPKFPKNGPPPSLPPHLQWMTLLLGCWWYRLGIAPP